MSVRLSILAELPPPPDPPPGGGDFTITFEVLSDDFVSPVQAFVAPSVVWLRAIAEGSAHPLRTVFPSRDVTVFDGQAPELIYDEAYHKIEYDWAITRPAGAATTFQPPGPHGYNMPTAWNNRNRAFGPLIAVTLDKPGLHTITCTGKDRTGQVATASISFTAVDPDVAYAGPLTVACRPVGDVDDSWIPAGATVIDTGATDLDRMLAASAAVFTATGLTTSIGRRLLLKPGHTYDIKQFGGRNTGNTTPGITAIFNMPSSGVNTPRRWYVGTPLDTAPATVLTGEKEFVGGGANAKIASCTVNNVLMYGPWDALTETMKDGATRSEHSGITGQFAFTHYSIHKCLIDGYWGVTPQITSSAPAAITGMLFRRGYSECFLTNWGDYGWFMNADSFIERPPFVKPATQAAAAVSYHGTKWFRDPNAPQGGRLLVDVPQGGNNKYPLTRGTGFEWLYAGAADFGHWTWQQPMNRWGDNDRVDATTNLRIPYPRYNFDRVVYESKFGFASGGPAGNPPCPYNTVIDRILVIAQVNAQFGIQIRTGTTLRNFVAIVPGQQAYAKDYSRVTSFISFAAGDTAQPFYTAQPIEVYNGTLVMLRTPAQNVEPNTAQDPNQVPVILDPDSASDTRLTYDMWNIVIHQPEFSGQSAGEFISSTMSGVVPRAKGDIPSFRQWEKDFGVIGILQGETFKLLYSEIPTTAANGVALTGPITEQYWLDNPTHNRHSMWRSGLELNGIIRVGPTDDYAVQLMGYDATGITFKNNRAAMTGVWKGLVDVRNLRPSPPAEQATPSDTLLSWVPSAGNPAYQTGVAPVPSQDFFGANQSPRNRGAF